MSDIYKYGNYENFGFFVAHLQKLDRERVMPDEENPYGPANELLAGKVLLAAAVVRRDIVVPQAAEAETNRRRAGSHEMLRILRPVMSTFVDSTVFVNPYTKHAREGIQLNDEALMQLRDAHLRGFIGITHQVQDIANSKN